MPELCKLIIKSYADDTFGTEKGVFNSAVNPANLRISNNINYSTSSMMGRGEVGLRYKTADPREMSFKLVFDDSGVVSATPLPIEKQISDLKKVVSDFQQDISEPLYIRVIWGTVDFKGKLTNISITYTHFKMDGTPIRAEVDMIILEYTAKPSTANAATEEKSAQDSNKDTANKDANDSSTNKDNKAANKDDKAANKDDKAANKDANNETNNIGQTSTVPTTGPGLGAKLGDVNALRGGLLGEGLGGRLGGGLLGGLLGGGVMGLLGAALLAGPLGTLLKKLWEKLKSWFKKGIAFIKQKTGKAKDKVADMKNKDGSKGTSTTSKSGGNLLNKTKNSSSSSSSKGSFSSLSNKIKKGNNMLRTTPKR